MGRASAVRSAGAAALLPPLLWGCAPPAPVVLTPEAALPACEAEAGRELRRVDPTVVAARLEPLDAARVERRTPPPGEPGVGLVIQGRGSAQGGAGRFRYTCLVGTGGGVLFAAVEPQGGGQALAECAGRPGGPGTCLRGLLSGADATLARAEAEAVNDGRRRNGGRRAEVDEPAAASIGAWRVYRDAECARRHPAGSDQEAACLVDLTRARIGELRG